MADRPLRIFGLDPAPKLDAPPSFVDDTVGRFRSGYTLNGRPATVSDWRITTGDPVVADRVFDLFGGDAPQPWEAKGEDKIEVFSGVDGVDVILAGPSALRQRMVLWSRQGKLIIDSDGETYADGTPDPDAELSFQERKGQDGLGPAPQIELYFRLAADPDLGIFKFQTGSWSMAQDLARYDVDGRPAEIDGPAKAVLKLEEVSFVAKYGPRRGETVDYVKPVLNVRGPQTAVNNS
ncbi:hypothetical protein [Rathayibacter sp. AY1E6]|uniref:recombination directionality factor n=1 Tax=Rathayibacter sp. AY1E6 TaxID=2080554 RepID=UPI0011B04829|nr:hypothetical protein [Rathayibacter sp. AY1E6]